MTPLLLTLAFAVCSVIVSTVNAQVGCRNAAGTSVDWWIALKAPEGSPYGYIDSDQSPPAWAYDHNSALADPHGNALAETMQQIYQSGVGYLIYNDQPLRWKPRPRIDAAFHGHAKGILGFQGSQGFWLTHSTPNFPDDPSASSYTGIYNCSSADPTRCGPAQGQLRFGQSYLCITLNSTNMELAAELIQISEVVVPGADMKGLEHDFPEVAKIASGYKEHQTGVAPPQKSRHQSIQTVGGEPLLQFAMTPTRGAEDVYLYEQLIESELCSGLWVETLKEGQDFKSYCPSVPSSLPPGVDLQYETRTINKIFISNDLQWTNPRSKDSGDHSKWAVTHVPGGLEGCGMAAPQNITTARRLLYTTTDDECNEAVKVACMSDLNRAGHQLQRGGGAVCFMDNAKLWEQFVKVVAEVGDCGEL